MYKLFSQLFIIAFFLFPELSFGEGKKFTINGKIPEMPSGRMIVITQLVDRVDTLGRGDIHGGKFVVEGEMNEPCVALIYVEGYGGGFVFILGMKYLGDVINLLPLLILVSGLVASARLYLKQHTPAQVYVGYIYGAAAVVAIMY